MTGQHLAGIGLMGDEIFKHNLQKCDEKYHEWQNRALRAAYDLAIERMSLWIEFNGHQYVVHDHELGCQSNFSQMIADFKDDNNTFYKETLDYEFSQLGKAMRPQEDQ